MDKEETTTSSVLFCGNIVNVANAAAVKIVPFESKPNASRFLLLLFVVLCFIFLAFCLLLAILLPCRALRSNVAGNERQMCRTLQ